MTNSDSENAPVILASFAHEMEAGLLINALQDRGIRAQSSGETVAGFRAEVPGEVHVLVPQQELTRARKVMAEVQTETGKTDWAHVDVGEPLDEPGPQAKSNRILIATVAIVLLLLAVGALWKMAT